MPKRIVDGEALWRSQKLLDVPDEFQGEYANILPLAEVNGCFECDSVLVWSRVYARNRRKITPEWVAHMLDAFEQADMLERYEVNGRCYATFVGIDKEGRLPGKATLARSTNLPPEPPVIKSNGPLDLILRNRCLDIFGEVEEKKFYTKELREAVRSKGHDAILSSFEVWSEAGYVGKRPITTFLKNIDSGPITGPVVSPALQNVEDAIALHSGSTVFFHVSQKAVLAGVIREHGEALVIAAFKEFFAQMANDKLQYAALDFTQQVNTRIRASVKKQAEREKEQAWAKANLADLQAKTELELAEEEEIEEEL